MTMTMSASTCVLILTLFWFASYAALSFALGHFTQRPKYPEPWRTVIDITQMGACALVAAVFVWFELVMMTSLVSITIQ